MARGKCCNCCVCKASRDGKSHESGGKCCHPGCKGCANEDSRPMEERLKAIEYHWSSFSASAKRFLLQQPSTLTLRKFLDFFSQPQEIAFALMSVSVGTAHMLAYEYYNVGAYDNAKALALCGAFFLQCQSSATPIEEMMKMSIRDEANPVELHLFACGVRATISNESISGYLRKALPLKYQKMLGFESHSQNAPGMKYVDLISNDWNGTSKPKNAKQHKGSDSTEITIVLSNNDDGTRYEKSITMDMTLKSLFNGYADDCGVYLRLLRFSFNGTTLFLSSVGKKTPYELGMKSMDVITVTNMQANESKDEKATTKLNTKSVKKTKKSRKVGKRKQEKKSWGHTQQPISLPESDAERNKLAHSKLLSKVFEEMQPKLKVIRQELNDLLLDRQSSKKKKRSPRKKKADQTSSVVFNPSTVGVGAKAGKSSFVVNVGRVENLYKTGKRSARDAKTSSMAKVDLHGCTKDEALERLEASRCEWMDTAMHGSYPWVIPAIIVCGGGHQILAETVEKWIKETNNVANAPKGSIESY